MKIIIRMIFSIVLFILLLPVSAAKPASSVYFNSIQAEKLLDSMEGNLGSVFVNNNLIEQQIERLEMLHAQTLECVSKLKGKINKINKILKGNPEQKNYSDKNLKYLTDRRDLFQNQLAQCEIYSFRIDEAVTENKKKLYQYTTKLLFKRNVPLWQLGQQDWNNIQIQWEKSSILTDLKGIKLFNWIAYFLALIVLGLVSRAIIKRANNQKIITESRFYLALENTLSKFLTFLTLMMTTVVMIHWYIENPFTISGLELITNLLLVYSLILALLHFLLCNQKAHYDPLGFAHEIGSCLYFRTVVTATVVLFFKLVAIYFYEVVVSQPIKSIYGFVHLLSFYSLIIWCLLPMLDFYRRKNIYFNVFVITTIIIWFCLAMIVELLGYRNISVYLSNSLLSTILAIAIAIVLIRFISSWFANFKQKHTQFSHKIYDKLGVKPHRNLVEMDMIRIALYALILFLFIYLCLIVWKFPTMMVDGYAKAMIQGFQFLGFGIIPSRLIIASVLFAVINMAVRWYATSIARRKQYDNGENSQVAIASIVSYVGFSAAAMIAFVVAGFNFTSLAIILGALSVGIGLGLRGIVNNFISGIILLIEKPIKPGDRIIVGNTEGYVEKVRIRSTQIRTRAREDIIVPNENLITNQVTNLMFRDKNWRVSCHVGVAYDSDVDLVKKVLLEVGEAHPEVVKGTRSPQVVFREFAESSLSFQLRCVLRDVNKKNSVTSELNFAILAACRQHNIEIAYPQQDIHIKNMKDWKSSNDSS